MKKTWTRLLAIILCFVMCISLMPASAFALDEDGETTEPEEQITEHKHELTEKVVEPTCTEKGYTVYTCSCGYTYTDSEVPALGHTEVTGDAMAATCTAEGRTAGTKCSVCGEILEPGEPISLVPHTPEPVEAIAATCIADGSEAGTKCSVCGETLSGCGIIKAYGHNAVDVEEVKPTYDSAGHTAGTMCAVCKEILSGCEEIAKLVDDESGAEIKDVIITENKGENEEEKTDSEESEAKGRAASPHTIKIDDTLSFTDSNIEECLKVWNRSAEPNEELYFDSLTAVKDTVVAFVIQNSEYVFEQFAVEYDDDTNTKVSSTLSGDLKEAVFTMPDTDVKVTATAKKLEAQRGGSQNFVLVTLDANGGYFYREGEPSQLKAAVEIGNVISSSESLSEYYGPEINLPTFTFSGWNTEADGSGTPVDLDTYKPEQDITLFAQWTESSLTLSGNCGDGLTFSLYDNGSLIISGNGAMTDYDTAGAPWHDYASGITTIAFDVGVTHIGNYAFEDCTSLTNIYMPSELTSIGVAAFLNCSGLYWISIPSGVTNIGDSAFMNCTSLVSVNLPSSLTAVDNNLFYGCNGLQGINLPQNVTGIGVSAFCYCSSLTSIDIPVGVTSIGQTAFRGCSNLQSIAIRAGVASIGDDVFDGCSPNVINYYGTQEQLTALVEGSTGNEILLSDIVRYSVEYTITLIAEGGSFLEFDDGIYVMHINQGNPVWPILPYRDGYAVDGWYKDAGFNERFCDANASFIPGENMTLYAKWVESCTVTLDAGESGYFVSYDQDGTELHERMFENQVVPGRPIGRIMGPDPVNEDPTMVLGGWYLDGVKFDIQSDPVPGNITLVAHWIKGLCITFHDEEGYLDNDLDTHVCQHYIVPGSAIQFEPWAQNTNSHRSFNGWNTKADGSGEAILPWEYYPEEDMDLYAQWIDIICITFYANDDGAFLCGEENTHDYQHTIVSGSAIGTDPWAQNSDPGKKFRGWNTKSDGTGNYIDNVIDYVPETDMDLYAQWIDGLCITFHANDNGAYLNNDPDTDVFDYYVIPGSAINFDPMAQNNDPHMAFVNWNTKPDGSGENIYLWQEIPEHDMDLYAQWAEGWLLTLHGNGGVFSEFEDKEVLSITIQKGVTIGLSYNMAYTGASSDYFFTGWYREAACENLACMPGSGFKPEEDTDLYAGWGRRQTVVPGEVNSVTLTGEGTVTVNFTPEESGYYAIETNVDFDPEVQLYDVNNVLLAYDNNSGVGNNICLVYCFEAGNTYYIEFRTNDWYTGVMEFTVQKIEDTYTVTFDANGGWFNNFGEISSQYTHPIKAGSPVGEFRSPYHADSSKEIVTWCLEDGTEVDVWSYVPYEDITLFAKWGYAVTIDDSLSFGEYDTTDCMAAYYRESGDPVKVNIGYPRRFIAPEGSEVSFVIFNSGYQFVEFTASLDDGTGTEIPSNIGRNNPGVPRNGLATFTMPSGRVYVAAAAETVSLDPVATAPNGDTYMEVTVAYGNTAELCVIPNAEAYPDVELSYEWWLLDGPDDWESKQVVATGTDTITSAEVTDYLYYTCSVRDSITGDELGRVEFRVGCHIHEWGEPSYEWTEDNSSVTATRICTIDPEHIETETAETSCNVIAAATCESAGLGKFTAVFANSAFETQTKEADIPATGHSWRAPSYEWTEDNSSVTATRVCVNDASHIESETVHTNYDVTKEPDCENEGSGTYTAEFSKEDFVTQSKIVAIPAIGHSWGTPTYEWSEDNSSVTARRVCTIDPNHTETETINTTSAVTKEPGCEESGVRTYTAVFTNSAFETQTITADIPATGHSWGTPTYEWSGDNSSVTARRVCTIDPNHTETETVNTTSAVTKEPGCEESGVRTYTAVFTNSAFETQTITADIPATGHSWGTPTYEWSEDNSSVTARRVCTIDPNHTETETVNTTSVVTKEPGCEESGVRTYTAVFTNEAFEEQTKENEPIPALGHDWQAATYAWSDDNSSVMAKRICSNNAEHVETETVSTTHETVQPKCEEDGSATYTAEFTKEGFATQTKVVPIPATGHSWGTPSYEWSEDNSSVTANRVCSIDPNHNETETTNTTSIVTEEPTCEESGIRTYTASFTNQAFAAQTREANIPALGHEWGAPSYEWTEDNSSATATRVCVNDESHIESETVDTGYEVTKEPDCKNEGTGTYTAKFSKEGFVSQSKIVAIPATGHSWGTPVYDWSEDNSSVTATRICTINPEHVETETAETSCDAKTPATCESDGIGDYTATFTNEAFEEQKKENETIPALGHDWGAPSYEWMEDNSSVTATRVCANDESHVESETVETVKSENVGEITYTAEFTNESFETQTRKIKTDPIVAYVERCYKVILGREGDQGGIDNWVRGLKSGSKKGADIVSGFLKSAEYTNKGNSNEETVRIVYSAMLNREADADGLANWQKYLDAGMSTDKVVSGFAGSEEFRNLCANYGIKPGSITLTEDRDKNYNVTAYVSRCYEQILGRKGDVGGLNTWTRQLLNKSKQGASIVNSFITSAEFKGRNLSNDAAVEILYQSMMGRASDPGGKATWMAALDDGMSLSYVAAGFAGSAEFKEICRSYGITAGSITLTEYRDRNRKVTQFVSRNYQYALERKGDIGGLNTWTEKIIRKQMTPKQVAKAFVFSAECRNRGLNDTEFLTMLYWLYMGREPDAGGMNTWLGKLASGMSRETVADKFADSAEFRKIVAGYGL